MAILVERLSVILFCGLFFGFDLFGGLPRGLPGRGDERVFVCELFGGAVCIGEAWLVVAVDSSFAGVGADSVFVVAASGWSFAVAGSPPSS